VGRRGGPGGSVKLEDTRAPLSLLAWVSLVKFSIIIREVSAIMWLKMLDACQFCGSKYLDRTEHPTFFGFRFGPSKICPKLKLFNRTIPDTYRVSAVVMAKQRRLFPSLLQMHLQVAKQSLLPAGVGSDTGKVTTASTRGEYLPVEVGKRCRMTLAEGTSTYSIAVL
jgi:hypothetical protein